MSYTQFGYTYPSSTSQLLMTGQHPATPCCQSGSPSDQGGGAAAYEARLLSPFPRLVNGALYSTAPPPAPPPYAPDPPAGYAFYSSLGGPYELKESRGAWAPLQQTQACYPYDPTGLAAYGPYGDRYGSMDSVARRKNATRETTNTLKAWLYEHRKNPYPTKGEKIMLAIITKMTLTQVSTWFANARRRLKKENKMTWEPRNKSGDSADAEEKGEDNSSSSPPPCSGKKPREDSLDGCRDDDSQDSRVKAENNHHSDHRIDIGGLGSCSVKSESSDLLSTDCLSMSLGGPQHTGSVAYSPRPGTSPRHRPEDHMPLRHEDPLDILDRPKIWSLAHTATSASPPAPRRCDPHGPSPPEDFRAWPNGADARFFASCPLDCSGDCSRDEAFVGDFAASPSLVAGRPPFEHCLSESSDLYESKETASSLTVDASARLSSPLGHDFTNRPLMRPPCLREESMQGVRTKAIAGLRHDEEAAFRAIHKMESNAT